MFLQPPPFVGYGKGAGGGIVSGVAVANEYECCLLRMLDLSCSCARAFLMRASK